MNWTTEFPKTPGWYWMQDPNYTALEVVHVSDEAEIYDCAAGRIRDEVAGYKFYGPIERPTSPSTQNA